MKEWEIDVAGEDLEKVIEAATNEGPQAITEQGYPVAVVISPELFEQLNHGENSMAKTSTSGMSASDLNSLIDEALTWARKNQNNR